MNFTRDETAYRSLCPYCIALGIVSLFSLSIFSFILVILAFHAAREEYKVWAEKMGYVRIFYALALIFIIVILIVFGVLLINCAIGASSNATFENVLIVIVSSIIVALYAIDLGLTIKVFALASGVYKPLPEPKIDSNKLAPHISKYPVAFVPAKEV